MNLSKPAAMDLVRFAKMRGSRSNLANRPRVTPAAVTVIIHDLLSNGSILGKESCYICPDHHRDIVRRLSLIGARTEAISFAKHMVRPLEIDQTAESNNYGMEVMAYKL